MADVVVAIMTVVAGALLCVRGCAAIRVAVPAGAFVAAFLLGAGLVQATTDSTLLGTATVIPDNERWLHEPQAAADLQAVT